MKSGVHWWLLRCFGKEASSDVSCIYISDLLIHPRALVVGDEMRFG